ncbi:DUF523 domain-containing protein [Acinetobacter larvae]|nr:DUF523 domain-containing protein [Acinetobacter larvae]
MKFLISACLLGDRVRYDGQHAAQQYLQQLLQQQQVIKICPEQAGGLATPRAAAEIVGGDGSDVLNARARVLDCEGVDVSAAFVKGAYLTLQLAQYHQVTHIVLKSKSPSCGTAHIYDGHFRGQLRSGAGVTAALLQQHGFEVWDEQSFWQYLTTQGLAWLAE